MKVNDPKLSNLMPPQIGGPQSADAVGDKHKKVEGGGSAGLDQVTLSVLGGKVRELDTESPERSAYLEKLSSDVQAGRYNADPIEVSKKIVEDAMRAAPDKATE